MLFRAIHDRTERAKTPLFHAFSRSFPEGIKAQILKEIGSSTTHIPSATASNTEVRVTSPSTELEENNFGVEEERRLLSTLDDFLVDIAAIALQAPEAKQFPLDKGAITIQREHAKRSSVDGRSLPPSPLHTYPTRISSKHAPSIGRFACSRKIVSLTVQRQTLKSKC